jgi:hypothetical protein
VIQVYIIDYTRACTTDLRSRPLHKRIHKYITGEEKPPCTDLSTNGF